METDRDTCQQRHEAVGTGKLRHPQKNGRLRRSLSNLHVSAGRKTTLKVAGPGGWPRRWGGERGKRGRRVCVCLPYFFSFKAFFLFVGSQRGRSGGGEAPRVSWGGGDGDYLLVFVLISNKGRGTPAAASLTHAPVSGSSKCCWICPPPHPKKNRINEWMTAAAAVPLRSGQQHSVNCWL